MSEITRNLLAIANNPRGVDEVIHARAVKELERWRGDAAVDDFFKQQAEQQAYLVVRQAHVQLKQRILALKRAVK